jgi:hypothetical protein
LAQADLHGKNLRFGRFGASKFLLAIQVGLDKAILAVRLRGKIIREKWVFLMPPYSQNRAFAGRIAKNF